MQARNKYALMVNKYASMMITIINDIFGFLNDVCKMKSIFIFSYLMMAENRKVEYGVGKVFLMIKNGLGFMVSQMHSLFIKW